MDKDIPRSPVNGQPTPKPHLINKSNAREYAYKSAKVRRENGTIRNALLRELKKKHKDKSGVEITGMEAMAKSAISMAMKNPKFWELVRDTIGEKPTDNLNLQHIMAGDVVIEITGDPEEDADG